MRCPHSSETPLYLRELAEDDVPAWFERASDPESAVPAEDPIPESVEMGFRWLRRHRERFRRQAGIRWAIVEKGSTDSVGTIGLVITSSIDAAGPRSARALRGCRRGFLGEPISGTQIGPNEGSEVPGGCVTKAQKAASGTGRSARARQHFA
jgi:hypothetical protein